jgi:4-coumarate--CoA ligase
MYTSPWPSLEVPKCNLLSYIYSDDAPASGNQIWRDAQRPDHSLSAAETLALIKRFAVGLDNRGISSQAVVLTFTPNHIYVPPIYLATVGSKRCFSGVSPAYTAREVAHQMRAVEPAIVLIHPELLDTGIAAAEEANIPLERLFLFSDAAEIQAPVRSVRDWKELLACNEESTAWKWEPLKGDIATRTVAVVNFSSGTTGLPKGVCITHHNLVANAIQAIYCRYEAGAGTNNNPSAEIWLAFLPLYHAYSQLFTITIALKLQIPVYVMTNFSFEALLAAVQRFRITTIQAVPPLLIMLAKRPETAKYDVRSLDYILSGGAPLAKDLQNEVMDRFNLVVAQGFGMSETTCCAFITPGLLPDRSGSIGHLLPNTGTFWCPTKDFSLWSNSWNTDSTQKHVC